MASLPTNIARPLREFIDASTVVWNAYQDVGPNKIERDRFDEVDAAFRLLKSALDAIEESALNSSHQKAITTADTIHNLAFRCVCRVEGLCFITGEAGLIPRKDYLEAYESGLRFLESYYRQIETGTEEALE